MTAPRLTITDIPSAHRPLAWDFWNRALQGAWLKGWKAGADGRPPEAPYTDKRKPDGRLTWSRSFSIAWHDGYLAASRYTKETRK